jgi:hypothetical protein
MSRVKGSSFKDVYANKAIHEYNKNKNKNNQGGKVLGGR